MKILVVDATSSGRDLVNTLQSNFDAEVEVVQPPYAIQVEPDGTFTDVWVKELLEKSESRDFDAVIPGSESGVSIAEWVAYELGLPHNGLTKIWHRRNKQGMVDQARKAHLRAPISILVDPGEEISRLQFNASLLEKCIVKPVASGGSDNVYVCASRSEIESAITRIRNTTTLLGQERALTPVW